MQSVEGKEQRAKDLDWYYNELVGSECLCGREKKSRYSFCYRCYKALDPELQRRLYRRIGGGYEEAFEEAHKFLTENVWE
jgi:hypothetical protein